MMFTTIARKFGSVFVCSLLLFFMAGCGVLIPQDIPKEQPDAVVQQKDPTILKECVLGSKTCENKLVKLCVKDPNGSPYWTVRKKCSAEQICGDTDCVNK